MNEVSKNPLRRSTTPLDSGSYALSRCTVVANVPANAPTPSACRLPRPMPDSLSHSNRRGTRPSWVSSAHIPNSRSVVVRVGIITANMNLEYAQVITSTGTNDAVPSSSGILYRGNHKSHCAGSPGSHVNRSHGSTGVCCGRSRRTVSRNQVIDPVQPTRSASTVAGMSGVPSKS